MDTYINKKEAKASFFIWRNFMMYRHLYYLNRDLDKRILEMLASFIFQSDLRNQSVEKLASRKDFKKLIELSFSIKRENRPSVSQLSDFFRKYGCKKPGTLACRYAIELEKRARKNGDTEFRV